MVIGRNIVLLHERLLQKLHKKRNMAAELLFAELLIGGFIDMDNKIQPDKREELFAKYPEFTVGVKEGKVKDNNENKIPKTIKVRADKYNELKELWQAVNRNYVIYYDDKLNNVLAEEIEKLLKTENIFTGSYIQSHRSVLRSGTGGIMQINEAAVQFTKLKVIYCRMVSSYCVLTVLQTYRYR